MTDTLPEVHQGFPEGHPLHNHGQDPKKIDDTGRPIVRGKPWSECSTGLFLNVMVTHSEITLDRKWTGRNVYLAASNLWLNISSTMGRPISIEAMWGSCLEIPSDLGQDPLKQQYVTEWFISTVSESVTLAGGDAFQMASARKEMVDAVDAALVEQGL